MIIYLILAIVSAVALSLIFVRRLSMTKRDLRFQRHMAEEEALDEQVDLGNDQPEDEEEVSQNKAKARRLFKKADEHFKKGDHSTAEPLFIEVITFDEGHLDAHHRLGMIYLKREDFPQAELYFSRLVNLKKDPVYFSNLGAALYQQQRLVEAAEAYENAISLDNRRANRLLSAAQVFSELGEDDKALKYFELASRKKPKDNELRLFIAEYFERLERYEEALAILNKALEIDPYNKLISKMAKAIEKKLEK